MPNLFSFRAGGSIANERTFSRNQHGNFNAPYWGEEYPPNPDPGGKQLALKELTATWHTFEDTRMARWNFAARRRHVSGYTFFLTCNINRAALGLPTVMEPT